MNTEGICNCVLVVSKLNKTPISAPARGVLKTAEDCWFQMFTDEHLHHPLIDHYLQDPHTRVDRENAPAGDLTRFPTLGTTEYVVCWYGWRVGDIIRIDQRLGDLPQMEKWEIISDT